MKSVELIFSKSKIDKAGEALKRRDVEQVTIENSLEVLSNWRAFHTLTLDSFARVLKNRVKKVSNSNSIVAQRLKRVPSIILKLQTHKTMRLSTMQDIGGLRAIVNNVSEVNELVDLYRSSKTRHELFSLDDYIAKPKKDGYRGVHLVYKVSKIPTIFVEIQIRSHLQHVWATGVEVFGTLKNSSFKSGYGDKKWLEFFSFLSSIFALKESRTPLSQHLNLSKEKLLKSTKKLIDELKVIEQLSIYTTLYKTTSVKGTVGRKGSYSLILLNSTDETILVNTFGVNQIEEATRAYLNAEKEFYENTNVNVVLVNSGDLKKLEVSYPNYFMDTKILVMTLSLISTDSYL